MRVTEQTKQTAQDVFDYLVENPDRHNQGLYVRPPNLAASPREALTEENMCGTTLCVAGAAIYLREGVEGLIDCVLDGGFESMAAGFLGLDPLESGRLFYCMDEPKALDAVKAVADGNVDKFWEALDLPSPDRQEY